MKKTMTLLMLLVMGVALLSTSQVYAEEIPDDIPELHDGLGQIVLGVQVVDLNEEPEGEPEEEPVE